MDSGYADNESPNVNMDFVNVRELFEKYRKFVENNVETVGHLESAARILSYIVPGIVFFMHLVSRGRLG